MSREKRFFTTFLKSRVRYILVGGVLLAFLLALVPNNSYATVSFSDSDTNGSFHAPISYGCNFKSYNITLENGLSKYAFLGSNFNTPYSDNCGFYPSGDSISHDSNSIGFSNTISFYNGSKSYSFEQVSGSRLSNWNGNLNDFGGSIYNSINKFDLTFNLLTLSPFNSEALSVPAPFVIQFDNITDDLGLSSTVPRIDKLSSNIQIYKSNGDTLSDSEKTIAENAFYNSVNSSLNMSCGGDISNIPDDFTVDSDHCYIYGSFLLNADYRYYIYKIAFLPSLPATYNFSENGNIINDSYKFNFLFPNDSSYLSANSQYSVDYLKLKSDSFKFELKYCLTQTECDNYLNYYEKQVQNRINSTTGGFDASGDTNLFMSWFDVFNFGFTFPFRNFFTAFTDSTNCVSIPIIGGMLHNPNAQYCSWWSADVRNVLTPVFSLASLMIITGLIIHWLKGYNGNETISTKRGEK